VSYRLSCALQGSLSNDVVVLQTASTASSQDGLIRQKKIDEIVHKESRKPVVGTWFAY
jgi:hypothetical protein